MKLHRPVLRLRPALQLLALFVGIGAMQGALVRLGEHLRGVTSGSPTLSFHLTGALAAWAAIPVVQVAVAHASPDGGTQRFAWLRFVSVHLAGYAAFTLLHVALLRGQRALLFALSVVDVADGALATRAVWEAQNDLVVYASVAGLLTVWQAWKARDRDARRAAALETRLVEARLAALSSQVDPHFLFNALHTLSAVMYEDVPRTERLLASLGGILRATLEAGAGPAWTVAEERAHTERYLDLLDARFGDRLAVRWTIQGEVDGLAVPRFALQTLIENAVRHNASRREPLGVEVRLAREGGALSVVVDDDGVGFGGAPLLQGHALARLTETLSLLYGDRAELVRGAGPRGGARVTLRMPEGVP